MKIVKTVALVAGIAALAIVTGGAAIGIAGGIGAAEGVAVTAISLGLSESLLVGAALLGVVSVAGMLESKPKASPSQINRLNVSLVTDTPRKFVFGHTALASDLRYQEFWGADQEYCSQVIVTASHWVSSIDEIWLNDELAWTKSGGTQGAYVDWFFVTAREQATHANTYTDNWSGRWGATCAFLGCSDIDIRFRVAWFDNSRTSPFASSIPSRITIRGKGQPFYDPRFDDTNGGSGPMRFADQSTWAFTQSGTEIGRNNALALLNYLIGWRIHNPASGEANLAGWGGVPAEDIDLDSFITAANLCDELVYKADGTQEPRYRCDGIFSAGDDPRSVIAAFEASMNAKLRDTGGKLTLQMFHDDLSTPVLDLTTDDILNGDKWSGGNALHDRKNVVSGKYTDASDYGLYQLVDYPSVRIANLDGKDRNDPVDYALCQSPDQAQRLAKMRLERGLYAGSFSANFKARAWGIKDGDVVRLTHDRLGWLNKIFRVALATIDVTGVCPVTLIEENSAIYAAFSDARVAVAAAAPNTFDPIKLPIPAAIADAATTANWTAIVDTDPTNHPKPLDGADKTSTVFEGLTNGRPPQEVLDDLDTNVAGLLAQGLNVDDINTIMNARTYVAGEPINTVFESFKTDQTTKNSATAATLDLIGAVATDGLSIVLDGTTAKVDPSTTLAQKFTDIDTATADRDAEVTILNEAVITAAGAATARSLTEVKAAGTSGEIGVIAGLTRVNSDGTTTTFSAVAFQAGTTYILDSAGNVLAEFGLDADGGAYIPNLRVGRLSQNAAVIPAYGSYHGPMGGDNTGHTVITIPIHLPEDSWVSIVGVAAGGFSTIPDSYLYVIFADGVEVWRVGGTYPGDGVPLAAATQLSAGDHTITLQWSGSNSGVEINNAFLLVQGLNNTE